MSRAIQEVDCSPLVMPHPSIQQVEHVGISKSEQHLVVRVQ
jgi:hypothetical protein